MLIEAVICLSTVISHETRGSTDAAQHAVAQTVINRTNINHMGAKTVCGTVYKSKQFSHIKQAKKPSSREINLAKEYLTMCTKDMEKYSIGSRIYFNRDYLGKRYKTPYSVIKVGLKGKQHWHY